MNARDQFGLYPRLSDAVRELATSSQPMKAKLENIWISHLCPIIPIGEPRNLTEAKLKQAHCLITKHPADHDQEGTIRATPRKTRAPTHSKIATLVFEAYEALVIPAFRGE